MQLFDKLYNSGSKNNAFTLTEVLIAVGIVGVIAALVIPAIVSDYQSSAMDSQIRRTEQTLEDALNKLVVAENKISFTETPMYTSAGSTVSYEETSGKFIKKYLSVAKYYGDSVANADEIKNEAFAKEYYAYNSGTDSSAASTEGVSRRKFSPDITGACAVLKDGASLCLKPQVGGTAAGGIIDMNGPKGPNVFGRDYREITLNVVTSNNFSEFGNKKAESINVIDHENIQVPPDSPCTDNPYSDECCLYRSDNGDIEDTDDPCCGSDVSNQIPACASEITIYVYPMPMSNCYSSSCVPYLVSGGSKTYATQNGTRLSVLPKSPPPIQLYCKRTIGSAFRATANMSSTSLQSAIQKTSGNTYFTVTNSGGLINRTNCKATSSTKVYFNNGSDKIQHNGVTWTLKLH